MMSEKRRVGIRVSAPAMTALDPGKCSARVDWANDAPTKYHDTRFRRELCYRVGTLSLAVMTVSSMFEESLPGTLQRSIKHSKQFRLGNGTLDPNMSADIQGLSLSSE